MASPDFTTLLIAWRNGDAAAGEEFAQLVYQELYRRARSYLAGERGYQTLSPTALVSETFTRLLGGAEIDWQCRAHFFVVASNQMRRILIDAARRRRARQQTYQHVAREQQIEAEVARGKPAQEQHLDLLALDEALTEFAKLDPRAARAVELRFFGGLTETEAAELLGLSVSTLKRDLDVAKGWLFGRLQASAPEPPGTPAPEFRNQKVDKS